MTTARTKAPPAPSALDAVEEIPWYDLIPDAPEPPEDAMQQVDTILEVMSILKARYENVPGALWFSQSNVIYNSDIPGSFVSPDGGLVLGLETDPRAIKRHHRSYRIDEWGQTPAFVLEVASESRAARDLGRKRTIYAQMGAREYWRLDPTGGEYYGEPLVGERLVNGEYERIELHRAANGDVWSRSEVLGVDFYYREDDEGYGVFLLRDSVTGEWLHDLGSEIEAHAQTEAARHAAEMRAQDERQIRQAAEAQAQAAEAQAQEAEEQAQAAEAQAQEAEARAQEAEARNRELQAELERLRRSEE